MSGATVGRGDEGGREAEGYHGCGEGNRRGCGVKELGEGEGGRPGVEGKKEVRKTECGGGRGRHK